MAGLQFRSPATLEGALDGRDSRSGFVEAAGPAATAAVRERTRQSAPTPQPGSSGGEAGQWGTGGLEALHAHFHCSEDIQQDIQDPENTGRKDTCKKCFNLLGVKVILVKRQMLKVSASSKEVFLFF